MKCDVLAIGAHPDDVELGAGATLARLARAGHSVGVCHLTGGESGTRGDRATRRREAEAAAKVLGVAALHFLDCRDGGLQAGAAEEDALIAVIRELRPALVLGHQPSDRHPDHERAAGLTKAALFYARLPRREVPGGDPPHAVGQHWSYPLHGVHTPSVVVDVHEVFAIKLEALRCYRSQFAHDAEVPPQDDLSWVGTNRFWRTVEARARLVGGLAGLELAEGFDTLAPLTVAPERWLAAGSSP